MKLIKLKKGEKIIQIVKNDVYHLGLTNKGRVLQLDIFERRPDLNGDLEGGVYIDCELKIE